MAVIGLYEARAHWSEIFDRVERGERFMIARHGVPIADLIPASERGQRPLDDWPA
jgi:prevent-host-death family protein